MLYGFPPPGIVSLGVSLSLGLLGPRLKRRVLYVR